VKNYINRCALLNKSFPAFFSIDYAYVASGGTNPAPEAPVRVNPQTILRRGQPAQTAGKRTDSAGVQKDNRYPQSFAAL
jgi:hypothetical protein